ncbi:hypothetical protein NP493_765g01061, partial [Ridgeia piscesae]
TRCWWHNLGPSTTSILLRARQGQHKKVVRIWATICARSHSANGNSRTAVFDKTDKMADLEAVLADVSYLMAMEKSKSAPAARASKKIVLPDPSVRSIMHKHLEKMGEVTFDNIFNQKLVPPGNGQVQWCPLGADEAGREGATQLLGDKS